MKYNANILLQLTPCTLEISIHPDDFNNYLTLRRVKKK